MLKIFLENYYQEMIEKFIQKMKDQYHGEVFNWSLIAQKYFLTQKDFEEFDWMKTYPKIKVCVNASVFIEEFGLQIWLLLKTNVGDFLVISIRFVDLYDLGINHFIERKKVRCIFYVATDYYHLYWLFFANIR